MNKRKKETLKRRNEQKRERTDDREMTLEKQRN